jgi:hypothetical protein
MVRMKTRLVQISIILGFIAAKIWWATFDGFSATGALAIFAAAVVVVALIPPLARWSDGRR